MCVCVYVGGGGMVGKVVVQTCLFSSSRGNGMYAVG